jgi:hypothetical protein
VPEVLLMVVLLLLLATPGPMLSPSGDPALR